jgi:hypothetical protein
MGQAKALNAGASNVLILQKVVPRRFKARGHGVFDGRGLLPRTNALNRPDFSRRAEPAL